MNMMKYLPRFSPIPLLTTLSISTAITLLIREYEIERNRLGPEKRHYSYLKIIKNKEISPTTNIISISLKNQLKIDRDKPSHFYIREPYSQSFRAFTPVNVTNESMDFVVRRYVKPFGEVARQLCDLGENEGTFVHGPHYDPLLVDLREKFEGKKVDLGFIANGTGITAVHQMLEWVPSVVSKGSNLTVFFADRPNEFLLKDNLERVKKEFADNVNINLVYFCPKCIHTDSAEFIKTNISKEDVLKHMPLPKLSKSFNHPVLYVCGSPALMRAVSGERDEFDGQGSLSGILHELGYTKDQVFKF